MPYTAILVDKCQKKLIDRKDGLKKLTLTEFTGKDGDFLRRPVLEDAK